MGNHRGEVEMRKCIICGARVTNLNPKTNTCDPMCTRAKKNGVDRIQQANIDDFANRLVENGWVYDEAQKEAARALVDAAVEDGM
jgi:hypothetical protein